MASVKRLNLPPLIRTITPEDWIEEENKWEQVAFDNYDELKQLLKPIKQELTTSRVAYSNSVFDFLKDIVYDISKYIHPSIIKVADPFVIYNKTIVMEYNNLCNTDYTDTTHYEKLTDCLINIHTMVQQNNKIVLGYCIDNAGFPHKCHAYSLIAWKENELTHIGIYDSLYYEKVGNKKGTWDNIMERIDRFDDKQLFQFENLSTKCLKYFNTGCLQYYYDVLYCYIFSIQFLVHVVYYYPMSRNITTAIDSAIRSVMVMTRDYSTLGRTITKESVAFQLKTLFMTCMVILLSIQNAFANKRIDNSSRHIEIIQCAVLFIFKYILKSETYQFRNYFVYYDANKINKCETEEQYEKLFNRLELYIENAKNDDGQPLKPCAIQ